MIVYVNRCIRSSGFNDIAVFRQFITEIMGTSQFTTKICSYHTSGFETILLEKKVDQFHRGMFRTTRKDPSVPCEIINDGEVRVESIKRFDYAISLRVRFLVVIRGGSNETKVAEKSCTCTFYTFR